MASSSLHSDVPSLKVPSDVTHIIDDKAITRVPLQIKWEFSCDTPLTRKNLYITLKYLVCLAVSECYWGWDLSDKHASHITQRIYESLLQSSDYQFFDNKADKIKRAVLSGSGTLISRYPTFPVQLNSFSFTTIQKMTLIKKSRARGILSYRFHMRHKWMSERIFKNISGDPKVKIIEDGSNNRVSHQFTKIWNLKPEYNKFNLRRVLEVVDISAKIKITTDDSVQEYLKWFDSSDSHQNATASHSKFMTSITNKLPYKGKMISHKSNK